MLEIDGSQKSGSGTILRLSIALAGILGEPLHIYNIRQKRTQPGLRHQHLEAVLTAARLCRAEIRGAELASDEVWFEPGEIEGGEVQSDIGTAGSIPMLLMTVLPICAFAKHPVQLHVVRGGTDVRYSPTINYLKHILLPVLSRMGLRAALSIRKYGYYPKGMGEVFLDVRPCKRFGYLRLQEFGRLEELSGISVCTFLADRSVAERQAKAATEYLSDRGYRIRVQVVNDRSNSIQKGSSLVLWARSDTDVLLGGDAIGELHKSSEVVGREAAVSLSKEIENRATVDMHLADMLVPYMALAEDSSCFLTRSLTNHLDTNIWLAQKMLGVKFNIQRKRDLFRIEKKAS